MTTIKELQAQALELRMVQGWEKTSPEQRVMYLVSEIGELSREVVALTNPNEAGYKSATTKEALGFEIYDVVWNLCDLANILDIDLEAAFVKKAQINRNRIW